MFARRLYLFHITAYVLRCFCVLNGRSVTALVSADIRGYSREAGAIPMKEGGSYLRDVVGRFIVRFRDARRLRVGVAARLLICAFVGRANEFNRSVDGRPFQRLSLF